MRITLLQMFAILSGISCGLAWGSHEARQQQRIERLEQYARYIGDGVEANDFRRFMEDQ